MTHNTTIIKMCSQCYSNNLEKDELREEIICRNCGMVLRGVYHTNITYPDPDILTITITENKIKIKPEIEQTQKQKIKKIIRGKTW